MARSTLVYATIAQSASVSGDIALAGADLFGVWCPVVTSAANLFVQAAFATEGSSPSSANFVRAQNASGVGDWAAQIGAGSKAFTLQDPAFPFTHFRLETGVAQTDTRTFVIVTKFRTGGA